jgi:rhamnosyltransferase
VSKLYAGYLQAISTGEASSVAAIGPRIVDTRDAQEFPFIRLGWFRNLHIRCGGNQANLVACDLLISSGTLVSIDAFDGIGKFDETLFMDNVDLEWCCRARARGFLLFGVCDARLEHRLGDRRRVVLSRLVLIVHSPLRMYYQTRNRLLLYRRGYIPLKWALKDFLRMVARFAATIVFVAPRGQYLRMTMLAMRDGFLNRGGRLRDRD